MGHESSHHSPVVDHQSPVVSRQAAGRELTTRRERQTHTVNRPADEGGQLEPDEDRYTERGRE